MNLFCLYNENLVIFNSFVLLYVAYTRKKKKRLCFNIHLLFGIVSKFYLDLFNICVFKFEVRLNYGTYTKFFLSLGQCLALSMARSTMAYFWDLL